MIAPDNPIKFFISHPEDGIQKTIIHRGTYEDDVLLEIEKFVKPNWHYIDVGAHVGTHTLFFSKALSADTVYVIEPFAEIAKTLVINTAINYCRNVNYEYIQYALHHKECKAEVTHMFENNLGATRFGESSTGMIQMVPGDKFFADKRIDFIKIDVETNEVNVLNGLQKTIDINRPLICVEIDASNTNKIEDWLKTNNYMIIKQLGTLNNFLLGPKK